MLNYGSAAFDYEPYPICYITDVLDEDTYGRLVETYPDRELFEYKPELGHKFSLSEVNNRQNYENFLAGSPVWKAFYDHVKSADFVEKVLEMLAANKIDLGLRRIRVLSEKTGHKASLLSRIRRQTELSARFEFSMMPADGGRILPHTDAPNKLITLVVSMMRPDEWDMAWGGGTSFCLPTDRTLVFNHLNKSLAFEDVDTVKTFPFEPNQCVLFVKTYNSWHHVAPMTGPGDAPLRKTLTINIESSV